MTGASKNVKLAAMALEASEALTQCDAVTLERLARACEELVEDKNVAPLSNDMDSQYLRDGELLTLGRQLAHTKRTLGLINHSWNFRGVHLEYLPIAGNGE